ncbi:hypothetical protein BU14_0082s0051 [Porphyra umbilicalis]|uniref:Uncharacterized protein n=1 Tax=Porphyra umbilicalis TaxID=2786 RepID=A0A1X6PEY8_PORUM|nr:hypothetical protein BU14_0082s0051 [Porphyra umbilicalis]|eukprot:OSX79286.1 hypothetical protein BU14_0082s0051 [Porphyra umbilicalis]
MASPAFLPPPATVGGARRGAAASAAVSTSTAPTQGLPAVARRPHRPACLRMAADEGAGEAPAPIDMDAAFVRLGHKNEVMRKRASLAIADNRTPDTIDRLIALLPLDDVAHRRAAVQSLGMIGMDAVPALSHQLATSTDATVRASAVKGLAAVALYFPAERATFPTVAMDTMEAALTGAPDPVTKLATVGALGTLGSPTKGGADDGEAALPGNARAVAFLIRIADETEDLGVAAVAVGALASIGASGERDAVLPALQALAEKQGGDGSEFIREMAGTHASNLASGSWAGGGRKTD